MIPRIPHWREMLHVRISFLNLALPTADGNAWLREQPVDLDRAINLAGPVVEMDITTMPGGIFNIVQPGDGSRAFVQVVTGRDAETPIDFVAWTRDRPWQVYRYFGYADALGADQLYNRSSYFAGAGLRVRRTPIEWLIAGCSGVVILDPIAFGHRIREAQQEIPHLRVVGDSVSHARDLAKKLGPLPDNVELYVPSKSVAA